MGNCLLSGASEGNATQTIQVVSVNGGIMEFNAPVTAGIILAEFPHHAIVNADDLLWKPLSNNEELNPGVLYLLLPLNTNRCSFEVKVGHVRSRSIPTSTGADVAPFRMSFDRRNKNSSHVLKRCKTEKFSRGSGVWKVKLSISSEQLLEILSEDVRTRELIESVRIVAKCGSSSGNVASVASSVGSDQWSIDSSWTFGNKD